MKVLVAGDDSNLICGVTLHMEQAGWIVDTCRTGHDLLCQTGSIRYQLLVLEAAPPRLQAIELCKQLRRRGDYAPMLILTGAMPIADKVCALDGGADDVLTIPFDIEEFMARVRALVRRAPQQHDWLIEAGPLVMDQLLRSAHWGATRLDLSPREYDLLALLARCKGQVVTRDDIREKLHICTPRDSNVIEVAMRGLRSKLGQAAHCVRTVRGRGYRFVIATLPTLGQEPAEYALTRQFADVGETLTAAAVA